MKLPEEHRPIGKYGRMHREYLREVHPARLNTLTLTGELWTYLADLNEQAQERLDTIMEQMKAAEGVTEELKRTRQMEWGQRCNNIHNRAEEIVLHVRKDGKIWNTGVALLKYFAGLNSNQNGQYGQIYAEKFTSACLICKVFYGKMKAQ